MPVDRLRLIARNTLYAVALLVAAPASAQAETSLDIGIGAAPDVSEPSQAATDSQFHVLRELYEGLTSVGPKGEIQPGAAERWEVSDDGLIWTFQLRADARWSDDKPVTAEDFVTSFRQAIVPDAATAYPEIFLPIRNAAAIYTAAGPEPASPDELGVEAIAPRTLVISLERPTAELPAMLAHPAAMPVRTDSAGRSLFSGGFVPEEQTEGTLTVTRNAYHRGAGKVAFDKITFHTTENPAAAVRRFSAGELDMVLQPPPETAGARVFPSLTTYRAVLDHRHPPMNDARVRRALSLAIDRAYLAKAIISKTLLPQYSIVPAGLFGYVPATPAFTVTDQSSRESEARRLLAEAGYEEKATPLRIELRHSTAPAAARIAEEVANAWRLLGVEVAQTALETSALYTGLVEKAPFSAAITTAEGIFADPGAFLNTFENAEGPENFTDWESDTYAALLLEARAELDQEARQKLLQQAETLLLSENIILPLANQAHTWLVSPHLGGWHENAAGAHPAGMLSR